MRRDLPAVGQRQGRIKILLQLEHAGVGGQGWVSGGQVVTVVRQAEVEHPAADQVAGDQQRVAGHGRQGVEGVGAVPQLRGDAPHHLGDVHGQAAAGQGLGFTLAVQLNVQLGQLRPDAAARQHRPAAVAPFTQQPAAQFGPLGGWLDQFAAAQLVVVLAIAELQLIVEAARRAGVPEQPCPAQQVVPQARRIGRLGPVAVGQPAVDQVGQAGAGKAAQARRGAVGQGAEQLDVATAHLQDQRGLVGTVNDQARSGQLLVGAEGNGRHPVRGAGPQALPVRYVHLQKQRTVPLLGGAAGLLLPGQRAAQHLGENCAAADRLGAFEWRRHLRVGRQADRIGAACRQFGQGQATGAFGQGGDGQQRVDPQGTGDDRTVQHLQAGVHAAVLTKHLAARIDHAVLHPIGHPAATQRVHGDPAGFWRGAAEHLGDVVGQYAGGRVGQELAAELLDAGHALAMQLRRRIGGLGRPAPVQPCAGVVEGGLASG